MLLVKKCTFFINLFLVKIRLEIMFNIVLDRKGTFLAMKNSVFKVKGLTDAFGQKTAFLLPLCGQNRTKSK